MTINNKLSFIDNFQFLSSSLDSLVKKFKKDDFKYLSLESDMNKIDLVKQNRFYPDEYVTDFQKFKEKLLGKKNFVVLWPTGKLMAKNINMILIFGIYFQWKKWKIITTCTCVTFYY